VLDFDEHTITGAVVERFAATPDIRLKALMTSLVQHLHAFVRDVEPTFEEWMAAIQYLTRTGQTCSETRQEFILLSDVLGVSMLVDAINHRQPEGVTETTVLGPFYVKDPPVFPDGADLASPETKGERVYVEASFTASDGAPIAGAAVDVWQSDGDGFYDVQRLELAGANLRGRLFAGADGKVRLWSITPQYYPIPHDGPVGELLAATKRHPYRPAHLHFMVSAPGYETLVTHIFVAGDPYLESDPVFGVKKSLIDPFPEQPAGAAPDGREMTEPWRRLIYRFTLKKAAENSAAAE
jgi:hydroxyquinol 1,2-dioxygenase